MISRLAEFDAAFASHSAPKKKRVLCLDDAASIRLLGSEGFDFIAVKDAQEALRELCVHRIDLVLLNLEWAGKNGLELFEMILEVNPFLPVIVLTAQLSPPELQKLSRAAVILKQPLNMALLLEVLGRLAQEPFERRLHRLSGHRPILLPADAA